MEKLDFSKYSGALRHLAFDVANSLGRRHEIDDEIGLYGPVFDPFQLDIQKLISSKSFRRLADKTQVFLPRQHANIRNRLIHTNDVFSVSMLVADITGLNRNLVGAIAYGHDIGHTPYGHLGEKLITKSSGCAFSHAVMGVVLAQCIERAGRGLNLTYEVLEGILYHSRGDKEMAIFSNVTQEASLVMIADKIGYCFSDINDAIRLGYLQGNDIPEDLLAIFGRNQRERVARTIYALIKESAEAGRISFSLSETAQAFTFLRDWMYKTVYLPLNLLWERECLFSQLSEIEKFFANLPELAGLDSFLPLALLTDSEANALRAENRIGDLISDEDRKRFGFLEIISRLGQNRKINIFDSDLHKKDFRFK